MIKRCAMLAAGPLLITSRAHAAELVMKVSSIDLSLTGSDAASALHQRNGALLALDQANETHALRELLIWGVSFALMGALYLFVQRTKLGRAIRATAQDPKAAR